MELPQGQFWSGRTFGPQWGYEQAVAVANPAAGGGFVVKGIPGHLEFIRLLHFTLKASAQVAGRLIQVQMIRERVLVYEAFPFVEVKAGETIAIQLSESPGVVVAAKVGKWAQSTIPTVPLLPEDELKINLVEGQTEDQVEGIGALIEVYEKTPALPFNLRGDVESLARELTRAVQGG